MASCHCMRWVSWSVENGNIPPNAVLAGTENDVDIFVIRGFWAGGVYPGKFMPDLKKAFATYNRKDIPLKKFEVSLEIFSGIVRK